MRTRCWLALGLLTVAAPPQAAEDYPARPIRMLLPQAPGSTTDTVGRIVFAATAERLAQQLVVDNRAGAGGTLGMEIASRAAPDGYTLVGVSAAMLTVTPHVYRKLAYDPLRDFVPVGLFILSNMAVCVHGKLPVKSVQDVVKLARDKPGQLNMASAGIGSTSHLAGVLFTRLAGISANHVPYSSCNLVGDTASKKSSHNSTSRATPFFCHDLLLRAMNNSNSRRSLTSSEERGISS